MNHRLELASSALSIAMCTLAMGASCTNPGGGDSLESRFQDPCVYERSGRRVNRTLEDGERCISAGWTTCDGVVSDCQNYCGNWMCQAAECTSDAECRSRWGAQFECATEIVSGVDRGTWCQRSACPSGTIGCPCRDDGTCDTDPFGSGPMACESDVCESSCPTACRLSTTCCGGAFCGGECIGTPCC